MKNILKAGGRYKAIILTILLFTMTASAQITLRNALDYDGDGKADYSIFRPGNNTWYIMESGGGFIYQKFGLSNMDLLVPGDYDGDGKGDIAVWRATTGVWYVMNSSSNTVSITRFGLSQDTPVARDYDGDGKTDLAVVRSQDNVLVWYVLGSSDGAFSATQFGFDTDFPTPGDYDGDKKFDFAVQRTGANDDDQAFFYILRSSNGNLQVTPWGISNDVVVPGDYDGDGKTDVAVVREVPVDNPTNLVWYILNSSDGSFKIVSYGLASDFTAQNDYDGDGKTDLAIWREENGSFYIRNNNGSSNVVRWGTVGDYPIAAYDAH